MNYGKKSTARKEKELTSKGTMVRKKFSVIFCKTLLICFFLAAVVGICAGIGIFKEMTYLWKICKKSAHLMSVQMK